MVPREEGTNNASLSAASDKGCARSYRGPLVGSPGLSLAYLGLGIMASCSVCQSRVQDIVEQDGWERSLIRLASGEEGV
jgi:hypothetical protein